jgi:hypothetical protein
MGEAEDGVTVDRIRDRGGQGAHLAGHLIERVKARPQDRGYGLRSRNCYDTAACRRNGKHLRRRGGMLRIGYAVESARA